MNIEWASGVINVFKVDSFMTLAQSVPTVIYDLDLNLFRQALKDFEDDADGMAFTDTHRHNTTVSVGGVDLSRVIEILAPYTVTFEDDQYAVNLKGANSNVGDRVNVNQVSVRSANSAGLVTSSAIEFGEYGGGVTVDATLTTVGTTYPLGTPRSPVGNIPDAITIANSRGFGTICIIGDITLDTGDVIADRTIVGENTERTTITINAGADTVNCEITQATVLGSLDGGSYLIDCYLGSIDYVNGTVRGCVLSGLITLAGGARAEFYDCYSGEAGLNAPIIDMGGSGQDLIMRNWHGILQIDNKTGTDVLCIGAAPAQIRFKSGFTNAANSNVYGNGELIFDAGAVSPTVEGFLSNQLIASDVWDAPAAEHIVVGSFGEYVKKKLLDKLNYFGSK